MEGETDSRGKRGIAFRYSTLLAQALLKMELSMEMCVHRIHFAGHYYMIAVELMLVCGWPPRPDMLRLSVHSPRQYSGLSRVCTDPAHYRLVGEEGMEVVHSCVETCCGLCSYSDGD